MSLMTSLVVYRHNDWLADGSRDQNSYDCPRRSSPVPLKLSTARSFQTGENLSEQVLMYLYSSGIYVSDVKQRNFPENPEHQMHLSHGPLAPQELEKAENYWVKESQKTLQDCLKKGELQQLSPFRRKRNNQSWWSSRWSLSFLWNQTPWISLLITRHFHQIRHAGVVTTVTKIRMKFWIIRAHDLAKSVKFRCLCCREIEARTETQLMADLPRTRLEPFTPPFHYTACNYFGPYKVKISQNTTTKHYGLIFTCMNTRAVHLELAVDYSTVEFMQMLRRFFSITGQPALMSDNGSQLVGTERELREMIQGWNHKELKEFSTEKGMRC